MVSKVYLIGDSPLLFHVLELLETHAGFLIGGVATQNSELIEFLFKKNIKLVSVMSIYQAMDQGAVDVLLTADTDHIIPGHLLTKIKFGLNFHNSLLPAYAGVNAPTWALLNNEKYFGCTIHKLEAGIDSGAIIAQAKFKIIKKHTAFDLNLKCIDEAKKLFVPVIEKIAAGEMLPALPQQKAARSYYAKGDRPNHFGYLNFNQSIVPILSQIRAFQTQSHFVSDFCFAKIVLNKKVLLANLFKYQQQSVVKNHSPYLEKDYLAIPAADGVFYFKNLHDVFGEQITSSMLAEVLHLSPAFISVVLGNSSVVSMKQYLAAEKKLVKRYELTWAKKNQLPVIQTKAPLQIRLSALPAVDAFKTLAVLFYAVFSRLSNYSLSHVVILRAKEAAACPLSAQLTCLEFDECYETKSLQQLLHVERTAQDFNQIFNVTIDFFAKYNFLDRLSDAIFIVDKTLAEQILIPGRFFISINEQYAIMIHSRLLASLTEENLTHYCEAFLTQLSTSINKVDYLTTTQKQLVFQKPEIELSSQKTSHVLQALFANQHNTSDLALIHGAAKETYAQVAQEVEKIAAHLLARKIEGNKRVLVLFPKEKTDFEIKLALAIYSLGATFAPIAEEEPQERLEIFFKVIKPDLIISSNKKKLTALKKLHSNLSYASATDFNKPVKHNVTIALQKIPVQNIAYILFTSGSTGIPKAVAISYAALNHFIVSSIQFLNMTEKDRMLQFARLNFDASIWEILTCFAAKACLVINPGDSLNLTALNETIKKNKISIMLLPPSVLANLHPGKLPSLRAVISGGEACSEKLVRKWSRHCTFYNAYGPTEATVYVSITELKAGEAIHMGKAIPGMNIWVMDKYQQVMPPNVPGLLYLTGMSLMSGYLNAKGKVNPDSLIKVHVAGQETQAYNTGDLAILNDESNFSYIGRANNNLIKIRGLRVDVLEVENIIAHYPEVKQGFIDFLRTDDNLITGLSCYCAVENTFNKEEFLTYLKKHLPYYAVPTVIKTIETNQTLINLNGKAYRTLLKKLCEKAAQEQMQLPENVHNKKLYDIYCQALGCKNASTTKDFFDCGGDSIKLAIVFSQISSKLGEVIPLQKFLTNPCFLTLQKLLHTKGSKKQADSEINKNFLKKLSFYFNHFQPTYTKRYDDFSHISPYNRQKVFFVTGATGFLGRFVVHTLAQNKNFLVYCLVRGNTQQEAERRLKQKFKQDELFYSADNIKVIQGDLKEKKFGLSSTLYENLAEQVDAIIHSGYEVLHLSSYRSVEKVNVDATFELIDFAFARKLKSFDFISTVAVVFTTRKKEHELLEEKKVDPSILKQPQGSEYLLGKIHSELALNRASELGLPVNVFRVGWITGDSKTGIIDPSSNHRLLLLKGCLELGVAPNWDIRFPIIPVDILARAIVSVHYEEKFPEKIYHVVGNTQVAWQQFITKLIQQGYNLKMVDEQEWIEAVKQHGQNTALLPLMPVYGTLKNLQQMKPLLSIVGVKQGNFASLLKKYNISFAVVNDALLSNYIAYLEKIKFFPGTTVWKTG